MPPHSGDDTLSAVDKVLQMMMEPQGFVGKTVRMEGEYNYFHSDENGKDYFACIVQDATACCA